MRLSRQSKRHTETPHARTGHHVTHRQFEQHVHQYQHRVFGFAYHFLGDREEAEDVTQEVFLRFWNHRTEVDGGQPIGWLLRVARNASVDALRRRSTYRRAVTGDQDLVDRARGDAPGPARDAENSNFRALLEQALDQLAEPYRSLVILRELQDLTYQDIADTLELPLTTVKVYLHRARQMLRNQLAEVMHREIE